MGNVKRNEPASFEEMEELVGDEAPLRDDVPESKINDNVKLKTIDYLKKKGILLGDATSWKVKFDDGREFDIVDLMADFAFLLVK
jgi:hypothetical protein